MKATPTSHSIPLSGLSLKTKDTQHALNRAMVAGQSGRVVLIWLGKMKLEKPCKQKQQDLCEQHVLHNYFANLLW